VGSLGDIEAWRGAATEWIDGQGHSLLPGFNDAHVHFLPGGLQLDNVHLKDAPSPAEFAKRISERVDVTPEGEWITGGIWDEQRWNPAALPSRELIDSLTPATPVFVIRYDVHMGLANSVALRLAGITARTPDPPGGRIDRDAGGQPTGILRDSAMGLVEKVIPPLTMEQRLRAVRRAMEYSASLGITSIQDMNPTNEDIAAYMLLAARGELITRIYAIPMETDWQDQATMGIRRAFGSPHLRLGAVKGYADGSLGSTTAYFFEPYGDAPDTQGLLSDEMQSIEDVQERLLRADAAGLQLCIHAIGDRANSIVLDMFEEIERRNGSADRRFRIEHAQHLAARDFQRFARLNVIASVQPYHAIDDGRWAEERIGPKRLPTTYAFKSLLDGGAKIALGTDWPVAPLNPMLTLYAAATRATLDGKHQEGWIPEQKLTLEEALSGYTLGAAYAEFQEGEKGSISPGKLADLVILQSDIFAIPPESLPEVKVDTTILGGKVLYSTR
jgi:predicted amidohydrolase YtcJ